MQLVEKWVASIWIVGSIAICWHATSLEYLTSIGPGPGFFPFWLGLIMLVLSILWMISLFRNKSQDSVPAEDDQKITIDRGTVTRFFVVVSAIIGVSLVMSLVGFQIAMFCFVSFVLIGLGRRDWLRIGVISVCLSFGTYYLFVNWLDVSLPQASISILQDLNL
jgi:putative tricarboxylic transport membrane protein